MRLDVGDLEVAEEGDGAAVRVGRRRKDAARIRRGELAHLDAALCREHVFLEAMRRELVEGALRVLHRELEQPDVVMRGEVQYRWEQHALPYRPARSAAASENRQDDEATDHDAKHAHRDLSEGGSFGAPT